MSTSLSAGRDSRAREPGISDVAGQADSARGETPELATEIE